MSTPTDQFGPTTNGLDVSFVLRQSFSQTARFGPDRWALSLEDEPPITYRDLSGRVDRYANALTGLGVSTGDRVGLLLYNSIEYWIAYLAVTRIGAIAVRLNFRLTSDELAYVLSDSGPTVLLADAELLDRVEVIRDRLPVRDYIAFDRLEPGPGWARSWEYLEAGREGRPGVDLPTLSSPAMLMYTSGTTGRPKGALWSHGTTMWFSAIQRLEWGLHEGTVMLTAGPLYHVGALENFALPTLTVGGRVVMMRSRGFDMDRALTVASQQRATDLAIFPSMIYQWLRSTVAADLDLSSVTRIFTGGDPVLPSATQAMMERYPWIDIIQVYGLTEGTPVAACSSPRLAFSDPLSVGRAMPLCEVSVRDETGGLAPTETQGEIWTRGPANSMGYWNNPEANAKTFVDGWCRTGDLGSLHPTGLRITGRLKDMIRSGGENIYPAELEDVLLQHPQIQDAAVIGVPDEQYIEAVCAVVVLAEGADVSEADVIAHCGSLARYKHPRYVRFVDEIPRTGSSKIQKYALRERFASVGDETQPSAADREPGI